jgi:hypothetical protein
VLVLFIDNSKTNGAVVYVKQTDSIEIMGNSKGGLAIVASLTQRYNKIEQDLNTLKTIFTSWVVAPSDGGAALKAAAATWAGSSLTQTLDTDIENVKIKHGQG